MSVQNRPKKANQLDQSGYRWDKLGKLEWGEGRIHGYAG